MSDNEKVFAKKEKKKRVLTDEQKEKLKENLKKGRETALKNRQKKALIKKIDNEDVEKAKDEKIAKKVLGKKADNSDEIFALKEELKSLRENNGSKKNKEEIDGLKHHLLSLTSTMTDYIKQNISKKDEVLKEASVKNDPPKVEKAVVVVEKVVVVPKAKKVFQSKASKLSGFL